MQKKYTLFSLMLLQVLFTFSQEKTIEKVLENTISSHLLENVHLHLNKTSFTKGEHLWFTAYVQDQITQLPSTTTTNLHVGIFDVSGKELKRKLLRVENGLATGDFAIDSTFVQDRYLVLGWTNYMKNFKKLPPFRQQIEIIDESPFENVNDNPKITLEAYAEGGSLISDAFNTVGIRTVDQNSAGMAISNIRLVDGQGIQLNSNISTNTEGFGKVGFMVDGQENYFLEVVLPEGNSIKVPIAKSTSSKVGLSIDNLGKREVITKLILSEETLFEKEEETYTLAIVQNNDIFIQDWQINGDALAIAIERDLLPYGINSAILFDENLRPIAWRMFFNHSNDKQRTMKVDIGHQMNASRDSVEISFKAQEGMPSWMNMSISVLPVGTRAYNPHNSLVSSFLMNPYLDYSSNLKYDLANFDRYKNYALDNELLVEGWGRYDWEERTHQPSKIDFKIESGIEVVGKILDADLHDEKQAYFMTVESKAMHFKDLNNNKSFSTNMVLYQNDSLGLSLIGKKGLLRKPRVEFQIGNSPPDSGFGIDQLRHNANRDLKETYSNLENKSDRLTLENNTIALDEVVVWKKIRLDNRLELNSAEVDGRYISDAEIKKYGSVSSYLVKLGFYIGSAVVDGVGQTVVRSRARGNPIVPITIAGMDPGDGIALEMPLERVQAILHDIDRKAWIDIFPREGQYIYPENRNKFIKKLIVNGYARTQDYFNPRNANYSSSMFRKFGAVDWKSNVVVNRGASTFIKVPVLNQKKLQLFIEGIGEDGMLISMEKEVVLEGNSQD